MKTLSPLCWLATAVFVVIIGVSVVAVVSDLVAVSFLLDASAGRTVSAATGAKIDTAQSIIGLVQLCLSLLSGILFLVWFYHADKNLKERGIAGVRYGPGWAVGGFFVPFLNLVRPFQVMGDVWAASKYAAQPEERRNWQESSFMSIVGLWWMLYLLMTTLSNFAGRRIIYAETLDDYIDAMWLQSAADLLTIPAAVITLILVRRITALQGAMYAQNHEAHDSDAFQAI